MALLLGEDGRGYDLARRLETTGTWRAWLGDTAYATFIHALASPTAWEAFLTSRSQIPLQLRARALLYTKASAALFIPSPSSSSKAAPTLSDINPAYLQLHGDDIYFSLEDVQDGAHPQTQSRPAFSPCKATEHPYERASCVGSRYNESEHVNTSQRHYKYANSDKETNKRTPEGMSAYLKLSEAHKRRRQVLNEDASNSSEEDILFFPEKMFPSNCVPDSALPPSNGVAENRKIEFSEVLDNLPTVTSTSPAMIERFGIKPEYVKMGTKYRGKDGSGGNKRLLSQEQATQLTHKVVARSLASSGFEAGSETSMEVLSELISSHICKLGRTLKLLTDSYRKQFSSIEVLKMFLLATGHSNIGPLAEITKNTNRVPTHQTQQPLRALQSQNQNPLLQAQQFQRQMHPQMNMFHPQNLTLQQQQQLLWRRQAATTPRSSQMVMDRDQSQPMVEVKIENIAESPTDSAYSTLSKHPMQMRHLAAPNQFRQLPPVQTPQQLQMQSAYSMRTPPVKVEAFHELVGGGDSTLKHEPDHNKLTSPSK